MPTGKKPTLGPAAIKIINRSVDEVFDKAKIRFLGPTAIQGKKIFVGWNHNFSLPGIFESASREEGMPPSLDTLHQLKELASKYIDGTREKTKARVIKEVQAFLSDAWQKGIKTDVKTVLGGQLTEVFTNTAYQLRRIVDTESTHAKNTGFLDGIVRMNALAGVEDPTVYFVVVRDRHLCDECKRLHMLENGITPRVWKLSEVGNDYHKKGEANPKLGGLHPHCRCEMVTLLPGYGFNKKGFVTFIKLGWDEYAEQHGQPQPK